MMIKDAKYIVDDGAFVYKTDKYGRVVETSADLQKSSKVKRNPKRGSQAYNSRAKGGRQDDDGGHLLAHEFNGPEEAINVVPMNSNFNKGGEWRRLEESLKELMDSGKDVKIKQHIKYTATLQRPFAIEVDVIVEGVVTKHSFKL